MKIKKANIIDILLIIFLCIQPIFDFKFFYNSISTLIRVIVILGLFSYYFLREKNNKKYLLLIYPLIIGIYFIFHHLNCLNFKSLVPGDFGYSMFKEGLYFVKMLTPFLLLFCLLKSNVQKNTILKVIQFIVTFMGLIIIISNLFTFSYGSYSDTIIKANILEWFNSSSNYSYMDLASKGLFEFGNQIAAVLIMFLPFTLYSLFADVLDNNNTQNFIIKKIKINKRLCFNVLIVLLNILALLMLSTKVSVFGIIIVFAYTIITLLFISVLLKNKIKALNFLPILGLLVVFITILPFNPTFDRISERSNIIETFSDLTSNTIENGVVTFDTVEDIPDIPLTVVPEVNNEHYEYIESNYKSKNIHDYFIKEYYPYKYDPDFWYNLLQEDITKTTDYRYLEASIIKRIIEINNNKLYILLGISYTRIQNIVNIERDFVVQYYALGIIGLIIVFLPYFICIFYFIYHTFHSKFKNLTIENTLSIITIIFLFAISYFTGNLLNSLSFTLYFLLLFTLMLKK